MKSAHRRHDISDRTWSILQPLLPGRRGMWGGIAKDNRLFINAVFWVLRTGAPWRDLPPDYGDWKNTHRRFCRWRDKNIWENLLEALIIDPDYEWLMIDATHIKVHPHAAGAVGGNQDMTRNKRGLNSKLHIAVDAHGMPLRPIVTEGTRADCKEASKLIQDIVAEYLLADKAYDTEEIIKKAEEQSMQIVIPPRRNRKSKRLYDKDLYKLRHLVENAILHLKRWRGIATRYAKTTASFLAGVQIRCIAMWVDIL
ncbi:MAG: IS5 family transposase [Chlamydiales bacterium]|nr:IS5 family transposase [Chlamydiales bacterium]MCP5506591.1 IS5 family transposase [Chlamydiales bacterium]